MPINKLNIIYNISDEKINKYRELTDGQVEFHMKMNTGLVGIFFSQEFSNNIYTIDDIELEKIKRPKCQHEFITDTKQMRSADESFTCINTCTKCGFTYTAN